MMFKLFLNVVIVAFNLFLEVAYVNCIKRIYDDDHSGVGKSSTVLLGWGQREAYSTVWCGMWQLTLCHLIWQVTPVALTWVSYEEL